jgi:hypothetical protein
MCAIAYLSIVVVVALFSPQRVLRGDPWCFDDWRLSVENVSRTPAPPLVSCNVALRIFTQARRVSQTHEGCLLSFKCVAVRPGFSHCCEGGRLPMSPIRGDTTAIGRQVGLSELGRRCPNRYSAIHPHLSPEHRRAMYRSPGPVTRYSRKRTRVDCPQVRNLGSLMVHLGFLPSNTVNGNHMSEKSPSLILTGAL